MKAIINGVRYDTEKATLIGEGSRGRYPADGDFSSWEAGLYVTPRARRYFVAGQGGGMSVFARSAGQNAWRGGSKVIPMSKEEALEWAEQNLAEAEIEAGFADVIEDA